MINSVIVFNSKALDEYMVWLPYTIKSYILFCLEMYFTFFLLDILLCLIIKFLDWLWGVAKYKLIESPVVLILLYKAIYTLKKYMTLLSPSYSITGLFFNKYTYSDRNIIYKYIKQSNNLFDSIWPLIKMLIRPSVETLTGVGLTLWTIRIISPTAIYKFKIDEAISNIIMFISSLEVLGTLIVITIVIFAWYFTSFNGQFYRAVSDANKMKLVDSIEIHKKLIKEIDRLIYNSSDKLRYTIDIKDQIIICWTRSISPFIKSIGKDGVNWSKQKIQNNSRFIYCEFNEIENILLALSNAKENNLEDAVFYGALAKYDMKNIWELRTYDEIDHLRNRLNNDLFSLSGFKVLMTVPDYFQIKFRDIEQSPPAEEIKSYIEEQIINEYNGFMSRLDDHIIEGIELLIKLEYYIRGASRITHFNSNKFSRWMKFIIDRE